MQKTQQRVLQALRRVLSFGATNPDLIPAQSGPQDSWPPLTKQLNVVSTMVDQATEAAVAQATGATNSTLASTSEPSLRKALREEMHHVTQVAQQLKKTVPGISVLRMPTAVLQAEALLKFAEGLTMQASTYESVLVEHGLPTDFIARLNSAIAALKSSVDGRGTAHATQVSATKQVGVSLTLGVQYVQMMDAALTQLLKSDVPRLTQWRVAKRITIVGVSNGNAGSTTSTTPAAATPVAATPVSQPAAPQQAAPQQAATIAG